MSDKKAKKVDKVFFAGDSFDRSVDYDIPAMECGIDSVKFNTSPKSIYINNQSLDNYVTATASAVSNSADCYLDSRLSALESEIYSLNNVSAQGTSSASYIDYCDTKITTATSTIDELRRVLENIVDKFEKLTKVEKKKLAGYTPQWYKCKLDLKTRRKNEFEVTKLLTI